LTDGSRNYELFQQLGLQTVPHLVFIPATTSDKKRSWPKLLQDRFNLNRQWLVISLFYHLLVLESALLSCCRLLMLILSLLLSPDRPSGLLRGLSSL